MIRLMASERVIKDLNRAASSGKPVRVARDIDGADRLDAYVVGVGRRWVLLHTVSDERHLDGHTAVRLRDVRSATRTNWPGAMMTHRALALRGEHVRPLPDLDLDSTRGLIETLTTAFPLVVIHVERIDPGICYIGRPRGITGKKRLRLQKIGPAADWARTCSTTRTKDITRFDAGGGYVEALHAVGGDPPDLP